VGSQSPRDTFRQIADKLREEVAAVKPTGSGPAKLGSETELSARFGVARNTLRKALSELARDGLVYSLPTKGWYISQPGTREEPPDHLAIAAKLATEIRAGEPGPGEKLTTAPQIASRFGVSLHTARQSLLALGAQGLIESQHGKGWYVKPSDA